MKQQIRVSPLTKEIFERYEGGPPPFSIKGFAILDGDEPFCIGCVSQFTAPTFLLFDANRDMNSITMKRYLIEGFRKIKPLLVGEIYAHRDEEKPTSDSLLRHFGFEPVDGDIYQYRG